MNKYLFDALSAIMLIYVLRWLYLRLFPAMLLRESKARLLYLLDVLKVRKVFFAYPILTQQLKFWIVFKKGVVCIGMSAENQVGLYSWSNGHHFATFEYKDFVRALFMQPSTNLSSSLLLIMAAPERSSPNKRKMLDTIGW